MMFISRIERNLGYSPSNPFAGMRPFVTEQGSSSLGTKAGHWRSPDKTQKTRKWKCHNVPYIFNVYLLILTPAYNALFLVPASRIPFLSSSCSIYFGIAYYPLILVQIPLFWRGLALSSRQ
jgi:hypothetical protein